MIVQVEISDESDPCRALARRLAVTTVENSAPWLIDSVRLSYQNGALQAKSVDQRGSDLVVVADFLNISSAARRKQAQGERLIKAVQGRQHQPLTILDATAGMAADAMLMASMGHQVLALERSAVVYELVQDGLQRAAKAGLSPLPELRLAEAVDWLTDNPQRQFDVVYLDPMFAEPHKRALPRKSMQLLRRLEPGEPGAGMLFDLAKQRARLRLVVKRPAKGTPLGGSPNYSIKGQRVRFDIYQGG